ncbi:PLP-dependent lyase/thiolase [Allokutzneria oryzae]|uniref:PLP-dependent lyase/thiolase n=1 Tax=Allokutzneria oryzae TaxID=1378989 RepID=A0ABV6A186_9PSEU
MPVRVHVGEDIDPGKLARMRAFGAKDLARAYVAAGPNRIFVEEGAEPAIAEGNGSIGVALLRPRPLDAIVVPVGDGALITGIATWVKHHAPATRVVGVCAAPGSGTQLAGEAISTNSIDTTADGIALRRPVMDAVNRMRVLVDDVVLVNESALLDAMALVARTVGVPLEPASAASLAALSEQDIPGDRGAAVLTGANPRADLVRRALA